MKKLYISIGMMLLSVCQLFAANYYVSPSGNDSNSGSLSSPFATIMRAQQAASFGDVVYLRGGTYNMSNAQIASTSTPYAYVHAINKSGISYFAYPGETPIINMSNVKPSGLRVVAFYVTADNCHFRGLEIVGTQVTITSHTVSYVFRVNNADNNIFERLNVHDGMATAVYIVGNSKNNLVLNCDSYNNWDSVSENRSGENTDGFGCHVTAGGTGNVFRGCRAWFNSDDGYDCIGAEEKVTIDRCWAFYNGYSTSFSSLANGNGFKVGGYGINNPVNPPSIIPRHLVQFSLAVRNKANGFYANHHLGGNDWYNNAAYLNGTNYNMLSATYNSSSNTATDRDGYNHKMRNNLGFDARSAEVSNLSQSASDVAYNYFTLGVSVTSSDFKSVNQSLLTAPRQSDGSLPDVDFMKLVSGSDLIDKGQSIGAPYNGSSPDLGYSEYGNSNPTPSGGTYEAENRSAQSGTSVTSNHSGYQGSGFVDYGDAGTWIEWNSIDGEEGGTATLTFRYANASSGDRACKIRVNGNDIGDLNFASTGSWSSWNTQSISTSLNSGNNIIRVTANGAGPNLDNVSISVTGGGNGGEQYVQLQNRGTGLFIDGMGRTVNGDVCGQYANTTHVNSQWTLVDVGSGYYQLRNRGTGLYLDGMGRTTNGSDCGQYVNATHQNSHWSLQQYSGSYYRIQNRATGLFLDGMGRTTNGSACGQYANTTSSNAQWQLITVSSSARMATKEFAASSEESPLLINVHPNPATNEITIILPSTYEGKKVASLLDGTGKIAVSDTFTATQHTMYIGNLPAGMYFLKIMNNKRLIVEKVIKK
jgi:hypothetical protein